MDANATFAMLDARARSRVGPGVLTTTMIATLVWVAEVSFNYNMEGESTNAEFNWSCCSECVISCVVGSSTNTCKFKRRKEEVVSNR